VSQIVNVLVNIGVGEYGSMSRLFAWVGDRSIWKICSGIEASIGDDEVAWLTIESGKRTRNAIYKNKLLKYLFANCL